MEFGHIERSVRHRHFAEYEAGPWRNGRGTTYEVAAAEVAASGETESETGVNVSPAWRISMATISEDAPFSVFPALIRTLGVVQGAGIELTVDGQARLMRVGDFSEEFADDAPASARPTDGPALDLNLMVDPSRASGTMRAIVAGDHELIGGTAYFVVALTGELTMELEGGGQVDKIVPLEGSMPVEGSVPVGGSVPVDGRVSLVLAHLDTVSIVPPGVVPVRVSIRGPGAETSNPLAFLLTISDAIDQVPRIVSAAGPAVRG